MNEPSRLNLCRACSNFVKQDELDCPFCGADIIEEELMHRLKHAEMRAATSDLKRLLGEAGFDVSSIPDL